MTDDDCKLTSDCLFCCGKQERFLYTNIDALPAAEKTSLGKCYEQQATILLGRWSQRSERLPRACQENPKALGVLAAKKLDIDKLRMDLREIFDSVSDVKIVKVFSAVNNRNGIVFQVCNPDISSKGIVVKVDRHAGNKKSGAFFEEEFRATERFFKLGLSPKPIGTLNKARTVFAMGKVDLIFGDFLRFYGNLDKTKLDVVLALACSLLDKFKMHRVTHGDFHWDNIGVVVHENRLVPVVLDLGFANVNSCDERVDFFQLVKSTTEQTCGKENSAYLGPILVGMYKDKFNSQFDTRDHTKIRNEYEANLDSPGK